MTAFMHMPFGWLGWALDWLGNSVLFNHSNYSSRSTTVAHWGSPRNAGYGAGALARSGQPGGYGRSQFGTSQDGRGYSARPENGAATRAGYGNSYGNSGRPAPQQNYAYNDRWNGPRPPCRYGRSNRMRHEPLRRNPTRGRGMVPASMAEPGRLMAADPVAFMAARSKVGAHRQPRRATISASEPIRRRARLP